MAVKETLVCQDKAKISYQVNIIAISFMDKKSRKENSLSKRLGTLLDLQQPKQERITNLNKVHVVIIRKVRFFLSTF